MTSSSPPSWFTRSRSSAPTEQMRSLVAVASVRTMGLRGRVLPAVVCAATLVAVSACGGGASSTSSSTHSGAVHRVTATHTSTSTSSTDALSALVAKTRSGVIRIEANGCGTQDIGTGFLIGPRLVATVEHVVAGATSISLVRDGKTLAAGTVIGDDPVRDVALVQSDRPLSGYRFQFAAVAPALGDSVAALGFPLGLPLSVNQGSVSGTGRTIPIDGVNRRELIQTDAAVNPGNSGGPLLSLDSGRVDGLIDLGTTQANGIAFAVSAQVARPLIEAWEVAPQTGPAQTCQSVTSTASSTATSVGPGPAGAVDALDSYWNDISAGEYAAAYGYLAPGALNLTQAQFVASEQQAHIQSVEFTGSLSASSGSSATVDVASLKTVDGQYGCRTWTGSYQMTLQGNQWLIERSNITPQACSG